MGSIKPTKTKRGYFGKVESSLNEKLENVEWGEYKLEQLFTIVGTKSLDSNAVEFTKSGVNFVGRTFDNNGIQGKIAKRSFEPNDSNTITATVIGNYKYVKLQKEPYYCSQNINKLTPKEIIEIWNDKLAYFFMASIQKFVSLYDGLQGGYKLTDIKEHQISLPIKDGKPDFEFMEIFIAELETERIAELEAYLEVTGLSDCELTEDERKALDDFTNDDIEWGKFSYQSLFSNIQQGRRLKKDDQISGGLPFVMSGVTNTGVVNHIANSVFRFPENSITVDIFGNTFYRNYDFGAGDDTGVYWNTEKEHSKNAMLFIASSLERSIFGKFSYGKKLRSSQSLNFQAMLPSMNNEPNYSAMELLTSAIQKLVIKDVVLYADNKIQAHKEVTQS
ncbi:Restriction endonuclease [Vibrio crassostreae]|nr:Restriction endonuclease [Vibrio crassostreae]